MTDPVLYTREQEARALKLVADMTKPMYVLRFAMAKMNRNSSQPSPLARGARRTYANTIREIDAIIDELKVQPPI